jgi:hypothetical protein
MQKRERKRGRENKGERERGREKSEKKDAEVV